MESDRATAPAQGCHGHRGLGHRGLGHRGLGHRGLGQRGIAALAILVAVALITLALTQDYVADFARQTIENRGSAKQADLDRILAATQAWYQANPAIETNSVNLAEAALLATVWPDHRSQNPGLRVQMSPAQTMVVSGSTVQYRVFAIWIKPPLALDTTSWTTSTNGAVTTQVPQFDPAVLGSGLYRTWSSLSYQMTQLAALATRLQQVNHKIQDWVKAQILQQSLLISYLRAHDCSSIGLALPCVDSYTPILSTDQLPAAGPLGAMLSLSSSEVTSPWGDVVEFSNLDCSSGAGPAACSTDASPYTASLRIKKPFDSGAYIYLRVEQ